MAIQGPRCQTYLPKWHPSIDLKCLLRPPFVINGTDRKIALELFTYKTTFLGALAMGARGSELVALPRAAHNLTFFLYHPVLGKSPFVWYQISCPKMYSKCNSQSITVPSYSSPSPLGTRTSPMLFPCEAVPEQHPRMVNASELRAVAASMACYKKRWWTNCEITLDGSLKMSSHVIISGTWRWMQTWRI